MAIGILFFYLRSQRFAFRLFGSFKKLGTRKHPFLWFLCLSIFGEEEYKNELVGEITKEIVKLNGKIREGFAEVKESLGSMTKSPYADLEKKVNALEAGIKALEKMVFP